MRLSNAILRGIPGAYLLQSGYGKLGMPADAAEHLKQFAATGVPQFAEWDSKTFATFIAGSELAVGAALVTPFVSTRLAGAGLLAFSAGLLTMYFRNPEMTQEDGIRPTEQGIQLSKDFFLAAIGAGLMVQKK
ncbi:MauE/DoxX family redox-associated membrane protein [Kocuria varians]|uniref:MauE/DoxX family redox-associated membrane protein n=1 Tax=Kocuria varians TaxID=1272 RepID=UPI0008382ADD|nr:MauE/DoxX family redox-associated membrane protein [Kocuria varians]